MGTENLARNLANFAAAPGVLSNPCENYDKAGTNCTWSQGPIFG